MFPCSYVCLNVSQPISTITRTQLQLTSFVKFEPPMLCQLEEVYNPIACQKMPAFQFQIHVKTQDCQLYIRLHIMINLIVILQNFTWMNEMGTMSWKCQDLQNVLEYGPTANTHTL